MMARDYAWDMAIAILRQKGWGNRGYGDMEISVVGNGSRTAPFFYVTQIPNLFMHNGVEFRHFTYIPLAHEPVYRWVRFACKSSLFVHFELQGRLGCEWEKLDLNDEDHSLTISPNRNDKMEVDGVVLQTLRSDRWSVISFDDCPTTSKSLSRKLSPQSLPGTCNLVLVAPPVFPDRQPHEDVCLCFPATRAHTTKMWRHWCEGTVPPPNKTVFTPEEIESLAAEANGSAQAPMSPHRSAT